MRKCTLEIFFGRGLIMEQKKGVGKISDKNMMEMLDLYNRVFPNLQTDQNIFSERLLLENGSIIFEHREGAVLAGFSVVNDDGILLLCVDENYRNQGIGTDLLRLSEQHIKMDFNKIQLGLSRNTYLFCGVPMNDFSDSHTFFEKHGYSGKWVSFDMIIDLSKYNHIPELNNKDTNILIRHRRNDPEDIENAASCGEIIDGWGEIYRSSTDLIVAEADGKIIGGVSVDPDFCLFPKSLKEAGSFGCLGVLEEYRNCGIGMKLCQEALHILKNSGCQICHIGYTWLDWWYGKLGAVKYTNYWMGEKKL
jgi:GNAT superfamily N-acetyltransferase